MHALDSLSRLRCLIRFSLSLWATPNSTVNIRATLSGSFAWLPSTRRYWVILLVCICFFFNVFFFLVYVLRPASPPSPNPSSSFRLLFFNSFHCSRDAFCETLLATCSDWIEKEIWYARFFFSWRDNFFFLIIFFCFLLFFFCPDFLWILKARQMNFFLSLKFVKVAICGQ